MKHIGNKITKIVRNKINLTFFRYEYVCMGLFRKFWQKSMLSLVHSQLVNVFSIYSHFNTDRYTYRVVTTRPITNLPHTLTVSDIGRNTRPLSLVILDACPHLELLTHLIFCVP